MDDNGASRQGGEAKAATTRPLEFSRRSTLVPVNAPKHRFGSSIPLIASISLLWVAVGNLFLGSAEQALLSSNAIAFLGLASVLAGQRPFRLNGVVAYSVLLWAFNFGLVGLLALGVNIFPLVRIDYSWILNSYPLSYAAKVAACGVVAFSCGANLINYLSAKRASNTDCLRGGGKEVAQQTANSFVGTALLFAGLGLWFYYFALAGGPVDYDSWLSLTEGGRTWLAYLLMLVGMPFLAAGLRGRVLWFALTPFGVFALIAFFSGLRGFVLYPIVIYLIADSRVRERSLPLWRAVLLGSTVFLLSIVAREVRQVGILRASEARSDVSYLTGFIETGTSIRPLYEAVIWHEFQAVPFVGVNAIVNPFIYAANAFGFKSASWDIGANSLSILIGERIGPYGGSVVAEAYNSFSWGGVVLALAFVGAVIAWMDSLPRTAILNAVGPAVIGLFLYTIRQDSTGFVINALLLAIATCLSISIASAIRYGRPGARYGRRPPPGSRFERPGEDCLG